MRHSTKPSDRAGRAGCRRRPCPRWWTPSSTRGRSGPPRSAPHRRTLLEDGRDVALELVAWSTVICAACSTDPPPPDCGSTAPGGPRLGGRLPLARARASSWLCRQPGCRVRSRPTPQPDHRGGGRSVGHPLQSGCGQMAPDLVEAVAGTGRGQRGRPAPLVRSPLGRHRGFGAGQPGRRPAGRLRNPGGLRPVAGRGRPCRRTPRIDRHRGGPGDPVPPRDGPVESGPALVPGRAPSGLQRTVADRYRSGHGRRLAVGSAARRPPRCRPRWRSSRRVDPVRRPLEGVVSPRLPPPGWASRLWSGRS